LEGREIMFGYIESPFEHVAIPGYVKTIGENVEVLFAKYGYSLRMEMRKEFFKENRVTVEAYIKSACRKIAQIEKGLPK
jgi:hypothetical protein